MIAQKSIEDLTDEQLCGLWKAHYDVQTEAATGRAVTEAEMLRRLRDRNATEIPDLKIEVKLKPTAPTYDHDHLAPLLESLPEAEIKKAYSMAYDEVVKHPAKWNGTALNSLEKRLGGKVADRIQEARISGANRLTVWPKEQR